MKELKYSPAKEETLFIDLPGTDGLKIKTILRGSLDKPLAILVHGRPGTGNDTGQYLFARYLHEKGISSLRLFLYDSDSQTRDLVNCTIHTHAQDFDVVVKYLKEQGVSKIFAVGHSYGGPTILLGKEKIDGAVLWDPSHGLFWLTKDYKEYISINKIYEGVSVSLEGKGYILGQKLIEDEKSWSDSSKWAQGKGYPLMVITAPNDVLKNYGKKYIDAADEPKKYVEIKGATHYFFDSDEVTFQLFEETINWFKEIIDGKH